VIVLSGFRLNGGHNYAMERTMTAGGACKFITKPLDFEELLAALKQHVSISDKAPVHA